jgi:hypothetical protein
MKRRCSDERTNLECRNELRKRDEQKIQIEKELELFI